MSTIYLMVLDGHISKNITVGSKAAANGPIMLHNESNKLGVGSTPMVSYTHVRCEAEALLPAPG